MDQIDKGPDPETFTKDVEIAIDKLFNASRRIEINPLTNKPREVPQDEANQKALLKDSEGIGPSDIIEIERPGEAEDSTADFWELDSGLELEDEGDKAIDLEQQISQLDQALLTLEWEVSQTNIESATDQLKTIQKNLETDPDNNCQEILNLMAHVLEGMKGHPEEAPTSGPKVLQKGVKTLRLLRGNKIQDQEDRERLLRETKGELESAIFKEKPDTRRETGQDLEDLTEELDSDELEIEDVLQEEPVPSEPRPPEDDLLVTTIGSHIQVLDECIDQISPVEDLFARTPGMEKLYRFQQKIKKRLENQKEVLTRALGGDYSLSANIPDIKQQAEDIEPKTGREKKEVSSVSVLCPWQRLVTAKWAGRPVAFVPEDVAFCGTVPWWAKRRLKGAKEFQLKSIKAWPWSRIQPLMQGELSNQEERQLQRLKFPIVQSPDLSPDHSSSPDNPILLVLYRGNEGRVLILDTRLETIFLITESSWEASAEDREPWAGRIKIENESVSVLSMEKLLSSQSNE